MTTTQPPNIYQRIAALEARLKAEAQRPVSDFFPFDNPDFQAAQAVFYYEAMPLIRGWEIVASGH